MTSHERLITAVMKAIDHEKSMAEAQYRNEVTQLKRKLKKALEQRDEWKERSLFYRTQLLEMKK